MPATPRKKTARAQSTPGSQYGQGWGAAELTIDLPMPSGALCQVRRPGIPGLIKAGILDSLDALTGIVQTDHIERVKEGKDPAVTAEQMKALSRDKEGLLRALDLTDKVVEYVVLQPTVFRPIRRNPDSSPKLDADGKETELADDERVVGVIYTDSIGLEDKMYIFQFVVGGVTDLETFRSEFGETLGGLEAL
jgi:hypothetical protein